MKFLVLFILILSMVGSHSTDSFASTVKNSSQSKKTIASKKKIKKKKRGIASVNEASVQDQIANLEAKSGKKKSDYIEISELYVKIKKYDKAIEILKRANKPQTNDVLDQLSRVYNLSGDKAEEARALELIRVDGKASPGQLTRLGDAYVKLNKISESIPVYRESITKAPKYEKAYEGLYHVYNDTGNAYDARLVILEVLEKFGNKKFWLTEFCRIESEQNYHDNAKQICQKAIEKDPKNPDNHVYLALAFKNTENEDQSRKILFNAAKQFKKSEATQWNAGQMSCSINNWEQASDQFKACLKANPTSGRCHLGLGKALYELKKYDLALESMKKSCTYIKGADVEIRRLSYDLDKKNEPKVAKKYTSSTEQCSTDWFNYAKKNKDLPVYKINMDRCFNPAQ